jgi:hypothetical protein
MFDLVAYSMEGAVVFLGLFFVSKLWVTLHCFAKLVVDPKSGFILVPWWDDLKHRMGLRSVGSLFNRFLGITLAFQIYILILRFQLINRRSDPFWSYLSSIADQTKHLTNLQRLWDLRAFDAFSNGLILLILFGTLPLVVIAWVPILKLRPYLREVRETVDEEVHRKLDFATGDEKTQLLKRAEQVELACMWPNGDATAWLFIVAMVVCALVTILPPLAAYFIGMGVVTSLVKLAPFPWSKGRP